MTKAVIDTNILMSALSSRSIHHWLVAALIDEQFQLFITDANKKQQEQPFHARAFSNKIIKEMGTKGYRLL